MGRVSRILYRHGHDDFRPSGSVEITLSPHDKEQLAALLEDICHDEETFIDSARTWACALLKEINDS